MVLWSLLAQTAVSAIRSRRGPTPSLALVLTASLLVAMVGPVAAQDTPVLSGQWWLYASWQASYEEWQDSFPDGTHYEYEDYYPGSGRWPPWTEAHGSLGSYAVEQQGTSLAGSAPSPYGDILLQGSVSGSTITVTITQPTIPAEQDCLQLSEDYSFRLTADIHSGCAEGRVERVGRISCVETCGSGRVTEIDYRWVGTVVISWGEPRLVWLDALDDLPIRGTDLIWSQDKGIANPVADVLTSRGFTVRAAIRSPVSRPTCAYEWAVHSRDSSTAFDGSGSLENLAQDSTSGLWVGSFVVMPPGTITIGAYDLSLHLAVESEAGATSTETSHALYVTADQPAVDTRAGTRLLRETDLPVEEEWLAAATSWASAASSGEDAASRLMEGIYMSGRWLYLDLDENVSWLDWRYLMRGYPFGNCVLLSDLWASLGRLLGFGDFDTVRIRYHLYFATVPDLRALDDSAGNAEGVVDLRRRWVFGMHQIGVAAGGYHDPTFNRAYNLGDEFVQWIFMFPVVPDPVYLGAPRRAFDSTGFQRFYEMHRLAPWGEWDYEPLVGAVGTPSVLVSEQGLIGECEFLGVDANSDGHYDSLQVSVPLTLPDGGDYVLSGYLLSGSTPITVRSSRLASAGAATWCSGGPGTVIADLRFSGEDIRDSGLDGPYTAVLHLSGADGRVADSTSCVSPSYSHLAFDETNAAPALEPLAGVTIPETWPVVMEVQASDPEGNPVYLSAAGLPTGATFDPGSGIVEWATTRRDAGSYELTFAASDGLDASSARVTITVEEYPVFWDVPAGHWAFAQVEGCSGAGIVQGYPGGSYRPGEAVTRAQMAVYISRALAGGDSSVPTGPAEPRFDDVPTGTVAYKYIEYAAANEIVFGYPDGLYHPEYDVDRGTMAIFVARAVASPVGESGLTGYTPPATPRFEDVTPDPADPYRECYKYVEYIAGQGIVHGYPDGLYHPEYVVSRGLMAIYVARAFQLPM